MEKKYFLKEHEVLGCIVGLVLVAIIFVTGVALIIAYAYLVTLPAFLLATKVTTNKILFAFVFSPLFVLMFTVTAPLAFTIKDGFEKFNKAILNRMYGPDENEQDSIW